MRGLIRGMADEQRRFELSGPQIVGGALASVTAAVAASYLGVAGTVIGAALVSIASTVATAVYTHYLKRTGDRVKQHTLSAWRERENGENGDEGEESEPHDDKPGGSTLVMPVVEDPGERARLPWVKLGAAAALVFAVSMGSILVYQAVAQQTVHEQITGTTPKKQPQRHESPADDATRRPGSPSPTRTETTPTPTPTPTPSRTPARTPTPTATDKVEPSAETTPATSPPQEEQRPDPDGGSPQLSSAPEATQPQAEPQGTPGP